MAHSKDAINMMLLHMYMNDGVLNTSETLTQSEQLLSSSLCYMS